MRRETTDVRYDEMGEKAQESDYGIKTNFVGTGVHPLLCAWNVTAYNAHSVTPYIYIIRRYIYNYISGSALRMPCMLLAHARATLSFRSSRDNVNNNASETRLKIFTRTLTRQRSYLSSLRRVSAIRADLRKPLVLLSLSSLSTVLSLLFHFRDL